MGKKNQTIKSTDEKKERDSFQATGTFCVALMRNLDVVVEFKLPSVIFDMIDSCEF